MKKEENKIKIYNHNGIGVFIFLIILFSLGLLLVIISPFWDVIDPIVVIFGTTLMLGGLILSIWLCIRCIRNYTVINAEDILFYLNGQLIKTIKKQEITKLVIVVVPFWGIKITHSIVLDDGTFVFKHPYSFTNKAMSNESYVTLSHRKSVLKKLQREIPVSIEVLDTCKNFDTYKDKDNNNY